MSAAPPDPSRLTCEELVCQRVRVLLLRRLAWLQSLWGAPQPGRDWDWRLDLVDSEAAEAAWYNGPEAQPFRDALVTAEAALSGPAARSRARLHAVFGLSGSEADLVDLLAALAVSPPLRRILAAIDPGTPSGGVVREVTARRVLGEREGPLWRPAGPLAGWLLAEERHGQDGPVLAPTGFTLRMIRGVLSLDHALDGIARERSPAPLPGWAAGAAQALDAMLGDRNLVRVVLRGRRGDGAGEVAAALAQHAGAKLLEVTPPPDLPQAELARIAVLADRIALAGGMALLLPPVLWQAPGRGAVGTPLQMTVLAPGEMLAPLPDRVDLVVDLPRPEAAALEAAWGTDTYPALRIEEIKAARHLGLAAREAAVDAARARLRHRLSKLGRLGRAGAAWDDLVVAEGTERQLRHIVFEARARRSATADSAARQGLAALFHGAPGTGKTLAAEVLANALGAELLIVDLASIASKYVGETAKNLRVLFQGVSGENAVLMFDEADSLFTRRTEVRDAQDRHANTDTNYLLQLLDGFDGVALMTTNRKGNIDPAFFRRLRHIVEFRIPEQAERQRIWSRAVARLRPEAGRASAEVVNTLAGLVELTPAQICGAVQTAHYRALEAGTALDRVALVAGLESELAKEGRTLDRRLMGRTVEYA